MWVEILVLLLVVWLVYKQWTNCYLYWQQKGFPQVKGTIPFGSQPNNVFFNKYNGEVFQKLYYKLEPHPFGGYYIGTKHELLIRDPEFIKKILVKDFNHFRDRNDFPATGVLSKHLFSADGDLWRALRVKLTPTFTSGKLKAMFSLFQECADKLDGHFKQLADDGEEIEIKDWMARFTTDIICSCAFGLEVDSLEHPDNELREIGQSIFRPPRIRIILLRLLVSILPFIKNYLKFNIAPKKLETSLLKVVTDTVKFREQNNVTRNDFLDLLINIKNKDNLTVEYKNGKESETGDEKINNLKMDLHLMTAQSFVFFAAGFETSSSVLANCLYELTLHQDIQDKLRDEIDEVLKNYDGKITYQAFQEMPYLEQVINETMRKYPTLPFLTRICTKPYKIPDMNLVIDKDTRITIPVYALHHDPKYYPEPDKFIPERFSPENKLSRHPFSFLPFGEGPRSCIGMRFGLLQTKTGIVTALSKYKLLKTADTPDHLTFTPTTLVTKVKENIKMKLVHRDDI